MSINIGIIGLPQSGKTTIFNALTKGKADTASHAPESLAPHVGAAKVPEPRLNTSTAMYPDTQAVRAEVSYPDDGASVRSRVKEQGIGG